MSDDPVESFCVKCGHQTNDVGTGIPRGPCPICGETARKATVLVSVTASFSTGTIIKGFSQIKRPKKSGKARKPFFEERNLNELYRKTGRMSRVYRVLDYLKNWYYEKITDRESGEVIREVAEPLSEHRNRGSAKQGRRAGQDPP